MIQKLHCHYYGPTQNVNISYAQNAEFVTLESISVHISYYNVRSTIGNHLLFYDVLQPAIILTDGYYDLASLNHYLFFNLYKIVLEFGGQNYKVYKFNSAADWANEIGGTEQAVQTFGLLNQTIYNGSFFCNVLKISCKMFDTRTTVIGSNQLDVHDEIETIISAPKMTYQAIYFNPGITFEFTKTNAFQLTF